MQTSGKKVYFQFPECSLSYAKIMQTRGKKVYFQFPECSLSYAKINKVSIHCNYLIYLFISLKFNNRFRVNDS